MKKVVFYFMCIIVLVICQIQANAQTEKGKFLLGGETSLSFSSAKTEIGTKYYEEGSSKKSSFALTPTFGFFPAKNLAVGLGITYLHQNEEINYSTYATNTFYAGPVVQVYFGTTNVKPFLSGGFGFGMSDDNTTGYQSYLTNINQKLFFYEAGAGFAAFLNDMVSIELGIGYSTVTSKFDSSGEDKRIVTRGLAGNIGIVLFL
jgi:outer membrane protein